MSYGGFWRRFGAFWLDALIFAPAGVFAIWFYGQARWAPVVWLIPAICIGVWYHVHLVKRFGATPGKLLLGLRIVRLDGGPVAYKEALLRYLAWLVLGSAVSVAYVLASWRLPASEYLTLGWRQRQRQIAAAMPSWHRPAEWAENLWLTSEFLVLLTNRKRRALHDFLAGTVVIVRGADAPEK